MPFSKLLKIFQGDRTYFLILGAIFIIFIAGMVFGFIFQHHIFAFNHNLETSQPFPNQIFKLILIFVAGLAMLVFMGWLHQKFDWRASEELVQRLYEVTETDTKMLSNVMSELAQGNLSASLQVHASNLEEELNDQHGFAILLNKIIKGLQDCTQEFNNLTDIPCHRLCYIGADSFLEGRKCGMVMGKLLDGHGEVIILVGNFSATHFELRRKGFENALRTEFSRMKVLKVMEDHEDPEKTYKCITEAIEQFPHLQGIYITQGATPFSAARAVRDKNKSAQIKIVGHDLTDSTMEFMSKGLIHGTLDQNAYAQGYNPVILLYNYLVGDWKPFTPRLLTKMTVVTPENFQNFWSPDHGVIQSQESLNRLARPSHKTSEKPLRIAFLCYENSAFWIPVKTAVMKAKEQLTSKNTTVDWLSPEEYDDSQASHVLPKTLKSIIDQKYDGIATFLPERSMLPIVNEAVKKGIPVITFNCEPISLQGLIRAISDQAENLIHFSDDLANNANDANKLTEQITDAMHLVSEGSILQNNQVAHTQKVLENLLDNINLVTRATEEGAKATSNTSIAISEGAKAMEKTLTMVKNVETAVTDSWQTIEELGKHSERIDNVIDLIQDITSRVNVLALNAAIEATQADDEGQGFMVVANEVRRLARNADKATQEVITLVNQVKKDITGIENVMSSGLQGVQKSSEQTANAQNALHKIRSLVEIDKSRLKSIADAVAEIQTYSYRVEEAMNHVTEVSERNNKSVQDVNETTKSMVSQLHQVTKLSRTLEMMAQSELELLGKFNVSTHSTGMIEEVGSTL